MTSLKLTNELWANSSQLDHFTLSSSHHFPDSSTLLKHLRPAETEKINEALYESENYHKENQSLNEEVEVLNNKINDLTKEIELKENNFNEERKTLEKSVIVL